MGDIALPPELRAFSRWLAARYGGKLEANPALRPDPIRAAPSNVKNAAIAARSAIWARGERTGGVREPILVLAAGHRADMELPDELRTPRGFRVSLSIENIAAGEQGAICVLIEAPPQLKARIVGTQVYLWHGRERFQIGQFDPDGKALGVLPVGLEISSSDLVAGRLELEGPDLPEAR